MTRTRFKSLLYQMKKRTVGRQTSEKYMVVISVKTVFTRFIELPGIVYFGGQVKLCNIFETLNYPQRFR